MKREKMIEDLAKSGVEIAPDAQLLDSQIADAVAFLGQGGAFKDIDDLYPGKFRQLPAYPPVNAPDAPAQGAAAQSVTLTTDQLRAMMESVGSAAAAAAAREFAKASQAAPAQTVIYRGEKEDKKPVYPGKTTVPAEFWDDKGLEIFHEGNVHTMDGFLVDGRYEPCPRSVLLLFEPTQMSNVQRFGEAKHIVYICRYKTHDKREINLFKNDIRWGTEYWDGGGRIVMDESVGLALLTSKTITGLSGMGFPELKQLAIRYNVPITNPRVMAAEIGVKMAKEQFAKQQAMASERTDKALRESELLGADMKGATNTSTPHRFLDEPAAAAAQ